MGFRRATAQTISSPVVSSSSPPTRATGITYATGDCKISKDGGAAANTANLPVEIGSTGRYKQDLTADETNCSWLHVWWEKSGTQPVDINGATNGGKSGAVVSNGSNTATSFQADMTESGVDHWKGCFLTFTTGALAGQTRRITVFAPTTDFVTVESAFSAAPTAGDKFVIVNI